MALSNIDKKHLESLILSLNDKNLNTIESVKSNHVNYAKLKMLAKQMHALKQEALEIVNDSVLQKELHDLTTPFKLTSGNYYYLYENKSKKYFSLIGPTEWNNNDIFLGKYYYDYDKQFIFDN